MHTEAAVSDLTYCPGICLQSAKNNRRLWTGWLVSRLGFEQYSLIGSHIAPRCAASEELLTLCLQQCVPGDGDSSHYKLPSITTPSISARRSETQRGPAVPTTSSTQCHQQWRRSSSAVPCVRSIEVKFPTGIRKAAGSNLGVYKESSSFPEYSQSHQPNS
jgi:hypothetical protein